MTKDYELLVYSMRPFEDSVNISVHVVYSTMPGFSVLMMDVSVKKKDGEGLEYYELEAIKEAKVIFMKINEDIQEAA